MKRKYIGMVIALLLSVVAAHAQYDTNIFFYRGRQALADGKYSKSIEQFNILARIDTSDYWTFFYRGIAKYNLGDLRGALADFDRSVRLNQVFTSGYHYRAITESRTGDYDKALADLGHAISLRPGYEGLYFSRGVTYFLSGQFDKAVTDFDWYIRKQPKDPSAYLNRGASRLFLADTTAALNDYNKAIQLDRFEPEGYVRRGRLYAAKGEYADAIEDMDHAIHLDSTSTFAYFNRAIMYYELKNYNAAMADLDKVLESEPGNALTLYNRSLISAQVGNFEDALDDMDRVININPRNVLAYFNRASYFVQLERWHDALDDYDKAIELFPDFARAYMNRSWVKSMLGMNAESKKDYNTAMRKVAEYRSKNSSSDGTDGALADTTRAFDSLLSLDADFAKKDFDNELLQHRDIDIRLKPLYRFVLADKKEDQNYALRNRYENALLDKFIADSPVPVVLTGSDSVKVSTRSIQVASELASGSHTATADFVRALSLQSDKQYNLALNAYSYAVSDTNPSDKYEALYKAYYYMNRGVLRAEMIDFITSLENNVQTLTMDDKGSIRARVTDQVSRTYDYGDAVADMENAKEILGDLPYIHFNLGNLYCLSSKLVEAVSSYNEAVRLYPAMGDAYYNRGLVLIYLKDKEKGCIDLSRAGELGVGDAYSVIKKYCGGENEQ